MNAVLIPNETAEKTPEVAAEPSADTTPATAPPATSNEPAEHRQPIGFGAAQLRVLPLAILTVFTVTTVGLYLYRGEDLFGAMGLALYLSMWLGGGFGFLGGGILWAIDEMEADGAH